MKQRLLLPGLIVLVLALLALYLSTRLEWHDETVRSRIRGEAVTDGHLAARRMLERLSYKTERLSDPGRFASLPHNTTLFMSELLSTPVARHVEPAVVEWVRAGGHLVVIVPGQHQTDRFVETLGIHRLGEHHRAPKTLQDRLNIEGQALGFASEGCDVFRVDHPLLWGGAVQGYRPYHSTEEDEDEDTAPATRQKIAEIDKPALAVARWQFGQGQVTALCDNRPLLNDAIANFDHARIAVRVLIADGHDTVYFTPEAAYPSLPEWLFQHAPWAFAAAALLLLACLWAAIPRFGPIRGEPAPQRPGLGIHLAAVADFHTRRRDYALLAASLRDEVLRLLRQRHGDALSPEAFAAQAELPDLVQALNPDSTVTAAEFRQHAATLARAIDALRAHRPNFTARTPP